MNIVCRNGHVVSAGSKFCNLCGESVLIVQSQAVSTTSPTENEVEPLQPGTLLRERYIIQQQLGQGGFGRTYLAEDTGRFREKCVIKEFMPVMKNTGALKKAEELFQREAAILHQLEHPQIPRFWEIFRQQKQIFLVLDYIEGPTYQQLLQQYSQQGKCFNETEILQLFQSLLPILSYLHQRGVIHRDISPDNIILRTHDYAPVLIDMGGVKQVALEVNTLIEAGQNHLTTSFTCLGKVGYAPDEQLRLGLVAPHSDLYALAVSALVLMTGKKPQQLLKQNSLQWWCEELKLNSVLTKTINQMLALKPANRFQSADEILQVLKPVFSTNLANRYSNQPKNLYEQPTVPPNVGKHKLTFFKQKSQAISNRVKFLVPALAAIAGGLMYVFWKYDPMLLSQPTPTDLSRVSNLQLRSMPEVQNVPPGLFNYGGAPAFAPVNSDNMKDAINRAHPEFRLRYTEPPSGNPGSSTGIEMLIKGWLLLDKFCADLSKSRNYCRDFSRNCAFGTV